MILSELFNARPGADPGAAEFREFLSLCHEFGVSTFKYGDCIIQFQPKLPEFGEPQVPESAQVPGGWKRPANLDD